LTAKLAVFAALANCVLAAQAPSRAPLAVGIDHVPVAVADLDSAAERYRSLGFTLKPGRPHANGITNVHAKFSDGTEIELITAPAGVDDLTRTYRAHLAQGDGPAFLAFRMSAPQRLAAELIPRYVFFGQGNQSPTDRPEHFQHANSADSLISVWLAAGDLSAERRLLDTLGATLRTAQTVEVPDRVTADVAVFPRGTVSLLPAARQLVKDRPIVGLTVRVRDLAVTQRIIGDRGIRKSRSIFVAPDVALGYWLEFRQTER
jgi:hypothetical protein